MQKWRMWYINLTQGYQAIVDDEDYEFLSQFKWHYNNGYAWITRRVGGKCTKITMHNLIIKSSLGNVVDHINKNPLDNRKENLREASYQLNRLNSNQKNYSWHKLHNKYIVTVGKEGKSYHGGYFSTEEEAKIAAEELRNKLYPEFSGGICSV